MATSFADVLAAVESTIADNKDEFLKITGYENSKKKLGTLLSTISSVKDKASNTDLITLQEQNGFVKFIELLSTQIIQEHPTLNSTTSFVAGTLNRVGTWVPGLNRASAYLQDTRPAHDQKVATIFSDDLRNAIKNFKPHEIATLRKSAMQASATAPDRMEAERPKTDAEILATQIEERLKAKQEEREKLLREELQAEQEVRQRKLQQEQQQREQQLKEQFEAQLKAERELRDAEIKALRDENKVLNQTLLDQTFAYVDEKFHDLTFVDQSRIDHRGGTSYAIEPIQPPAYSTSRPVPALTVAAPETNDKHQILNAWLRKLNSEDAGTILKAISQLKAHYDAKSTSDQDKIACRAIILTLLVYSFSSKLGDIVNKTSQQLGSELSDTFKGIISSISSSTYHNSSSLKSLSDAYTGFASAYARDLKTASTSPLPLDPVVKDVSKQYDDTKVFAQLAKALQSRPMLGNPQPQTAQGVLSSITPIYEKILGQYRTALNLQENFVPNTKV